MRLVRESRQLGTGSVTRWYYHRVARRILRPLGGAGSLATSIVTSFATPIDSTMAHRAGEIYGYPPDATTPAAVEARQSCLCRFRGPHLECEQKNNRGQVALVKLEQFPDLQRQYQRTTIPLGLCSIMDRKEPWIVCPNRLFYTGPAAPILEHSIYQSWNFKPGDRVALWREVRIVRRKRAKKFNYNFDYVFRKIVNEERREYEDTPYVVEVMSCSTSGGGIREDFAAALGSELPHEKRGPSLNKRQVLGRMMSQLVAKAEVTHNWGGKTVWIVQDVFWRYVNATTGFDMDEFRQDPAGNMVVIVRHLETDGYVPTDPASDSYRLKLDRILQGWDRFERSRNEVTVGRDFVSLLNAPFTPEKDQILRITNTRIPTAVVTCAV